MKTMYWGICLVLLFGAASSYAAEPQTAAELKAEAARIAQENEALRKKIAELEAAASQNGSVEKEIDETIQLIKAKLSTKNGSVEASGE